MYNDLKLGIIELQYYLNGEPKEDKFHGKGCLSDLVKKISKNWKISEDDPLTIKWNNEVVTPSNYNCFLYEYRLHCFYISEFGNMLFDFQDVISFDVGFQLSIDKKLSILHAVVSPASQYSAVGSLKQAQISELKAATSGIPIFHHRGQANASTGHHVSIYYDGFWEFVNDCNKIEINSNDCLFAFTMCHDMSLYYENEASRQKAFFELLSSILPGVTNNISTGPIPDIHYNHVCFFEVKNEVAATTSDSFKECLSYYVKSVNESNLPKPGFLIELIGPHFIISGAVCTGEGVYVDRLVPPLWLVPQMLDMPAMVRIAKTFKALVKACLSLVRPPPRPQPTFPCFFQFDGQVVTYTNSIKRNLFRGKLNEKNVIIKFCEAYGSDVHRFLAKHGLAPQLLHSCKIGMFTVVVMDEVQNSVPINEYLRNHQGDQQNIRSQCDEILRLLKDSYVHGDLRCSNVLVQQCEKKVQVIDFDWAGPTCTTKYPFFMNHVEINWPSGAADGLAITHNHDKYWIDSFFNAGTNDD